MTPFDLEVLKPSMQGRVIANETFWKSIFHLIHQSSDKTTTTRLAFNIRKKLSKVIISMN